MKFAEDLRQLHALLEDGLLTKEEFEAQKAILLANQKAHASTDPEKVDNAANVTGGTEQPEEEPAEEPVSEPTEVAAPDEIKPAAEPETEPVAAKLPLSSPRKRGLKIAIAGLLVAGLGLGTWLLVGGSSHSASALIEELPANSRVAVAVDASVVTNDPEFQQFFEDLTAAMEKFGPNPALTELLLIKTLPKIESIACAATQDRLIACHLQGNTSEVLSALISVAPILGDQPKTEFMGHGALVLGAGKDRDAKRREGRKTEKKEKNDPFEDHHEDAHRGSQVTSATDFPRKDDHTVIVDMKELGLIIGHAGGARHILSAREGNTKRLTENSAIDEALSQVDRSGVILLAGEEPTERAGGGLIRGALTYALSVSVGSTLEIQAVAIAGDDTMRQQLEQTAQAWPATKASSKTILEDDGSNLLRRLRSESGKLGDISSYLADGAETSLTVLENLLENANLEKTESGLRFRAEADIPEGSLVKVSIGLPAMAAGVFFLSPYVRKSKTSEATANLDKIYKGASVYYSTPHVLDTGQKVPCQFPTKQVCVPAGSPCDYPDGKYPADPSIWDTPTWRALSFGMYDSHYFKYCFDSVGTLKDARFTATAHADLDCDGNWSTFQRIAFGDEQANFAECALQRAPAIFVDQETE